MSEQLKPLMPRIGNASAWNIRAALIYVVQYLECVKERGGIPNCDDPLNAIAHRLDWQEPRAAQPEKEKEEK